MAQEKILILDFGSQYTQLIARRVRELNIYCEIHPYNKIPELTDNIKNYVIEKGSISLDGISLTIAKKFEDCFSVALIPHTLDITTWGEKNIGDFINVEVDMMAKYLENFIGNKNEV